MIHSLLIMKRETGIVAALLFLFGVSAASLFWSASRPARSAAPTVWTAPAIGVIELNGPIDAGATGMFDHSGLSSILDQIQSYRDDSQVKAIIVRINSPGGTVGASQEIYNALIQLKAKTKKPVIVSVADIGASGAYWVALAGDVIVANPGSMVGSIGVIMSSPDFQQIPARYGVGMRTLKSGKYKDMLNSWRPMTSDETTLLQGMLDDVHQQFVHVVITERRMPTEAAWELAQGQIFSGSQAVSLGLIDQLGGLSDAIEIAKKQAKLGDDVEIIHRTGSPVEDILQEYLGIVGRSVVSEFQAAASPKLH